MIMPAAWNADRRKSQAQADFWNPTGLLRRRRHSRTDPLGPHHRLLAQRTAGLLRHRRRVQRPHRRGQPADQEDPARRARVQELSQLSAAPATALRNHLATSHPDTITRSTTTLGRVEPDIHFIHQRSAHVDAFPLVITHAPPALRPSPGRSSARLAAGASPGTTSPTGRRCRCGGHFAAFEQPELFVDDVRVGDGRTGRAALAEWFTEILRPYTTTFHLIGNHLIELVTPDSTVGS